MMLNNAKVYKVPKATVDPSKNVSPFLSFECPPMIKYFYKCNKYYSSLFN